MIIIIKIPVGQSQPTVKKNVTPAIGTLEKKKNLRRFILITAVKFYSKMKTPTQNNFRVTHHYHHQKYRLVNPNLR